MSSSEEDSYSMIFTSLKHPIRRRILRILSNGLQSFSDLQKQFKIESSHLTYHIDGLGNLLYKTEDGKYALSSLGEAAVSMMKNVEEPPTSLHLPFKPTGKMRMVRPFTLIVVCALIASLVFGGITLFRYNELDTANNGLNKAYSDLANAYDELSRAYSGLNRTYNDLKKAYDELERAYLSLVSPSLSGLYFVGGYDRSIFMEVWNKTRQLGLMSELSGYGNYSLLIYPHVYSSWVRVQPDIEWFAVASTLQPDNAGFIHDLVIRLDVNYSLLKSYAGTSRVNFTSVEKGMKIVEESYGQSACLMLPLNGTTTPIPCPDSYHVYYPFLLWYFGGGDTLGTAILNLNTGGIMFAATSILMGTGRLLYPN